MTQSHPERTRREAATAEAVNGNLMGCDDTTFVAFLAETVHPVVRSDAAEVTRLVTEFNTQLRPDGYQLTPTSFISGHPIYAGTRITASHTPATALKRPTRTLLDDHTALQDHLDSIQRTIGTDPPATIASAKELVETTYKLILDKRGITYGNRDDLGDLYKKVAAELSLNRESVPGSAKGSEAAKKTLGALNTTVFGLAELRNTLGRGHGRTAPSPALERHARLAFNAAVALTEFLFDTWQEREKSAGPPTT
ncbi:MAG: abortive infection family protein [Actinomycetota bacterium]|nr:abortive infection family protein [Actinomycetota bacterium]